MFFTERSAAEFSSGGTPEVAGPPGRRQLSTAACNRKHRPPNCGQNPGPPTRVLLGLLAIWGVLVAQAPPQAQDCRQQCSAEQESDNPCAAFGAAKIGPSQQLRHDCDEVEQQGCTRELMG